MAVSQEENDIIIKCDLDALNSFASTNPAQGTAKWVGLDLNTGVDDITKLTWNGSVLTVDDVAEAASVGLGAGHIVFWVKVDQLQESPKTVTIGGEGYEPVEIRVVFRTNFQDAPPINPINPNI